MTDKELLELAAKAAGIERGEDRFDYAISITENGRHRSLPQWNPLTDDGDALRLAVKLGLAISIDTTTGITNAHHEQAWMSEEVPHDSDPYAATRRAIVRAAAEIGRGAT